MIYLLPSKAAKVELDTKMEQKNKRLMCKRGEKMDDYSFTKQHIL